MADGTVEQHRPVEYRLMDFAVQEDGFVVSISPDGVLVRGACPGCAGTTQTTWEYGLPGGHKGVFGRDRSEPTAPPTGLRTVYCECGFTHEHRPPEAWDVGCGAFWQVLIG